MSESIQYPHGNLNHPSTVVVCTNRHELAYVLSWCKSEKKRIGKHMIHREDFPYCLSVKGDTVGWTGSMDRALYYMPFDAFTSAI